MGSPLDAIAPAVGAQTTVMPILNGLVHYAQLDARFGRERVLGGPCSISAMKRSEGEVLHLGKPAPITFGERDGDPEAHASTPSRSCARRPESTTTQRPRGSCSSCGSSTPS